MSGVPPHNNSGKVIEEGIWSRLKECWRAEPNARPHISELALHLQPLAPAIMLQNLEISQTMEIKEGKIICVEFSPTGTRLAIAISDAAHDMLQIWEADNDLFKMIKNVSIPKSSNRSIAWSPMGEEILTMSSEQILLWKAETGNWMPVGFRRTKIYSSGWLSNGIAFACVECDHVRIMDMHGRELSKHIYPKMQVSGMALLPDNTRMLLVAKCLIPLTEHCTREESCLVVYNIRTSQIENTFILSGRPYGISLSKDKQHVLVTHAKYPELWRIDSTQFSSPILYFCCAYPSSTGSHLFRAALFGGPRDQLVFCMTR
ncbi:hypothetical protein FRC02_008002, partial [Tulasnella sp. 418]